MRSVIVLLATAILFTLALSIIPCPAGAVVVEVFFPDGSPAAGVSVKLQNGNYVSLGNGTTDASGACIFDVNMSSGAIRALISSPSHNVTSVWHDSSDAFIKVKLPEAGEVTGTIKLDGMSAGNPVVVLDDAGVFDSEPYDVSRQSGPIMQTFTANRFSLKTTTGSHSLYAAGYYDGMVYMSDRLAINVSDSQAPVVLELKYKGSNASMLPAAVYQKIFHTAGTQNYTVSMSGVLLGADGRPLANATLTAEDYFQRELGSTVTGSGGGFAFKNINNADMVRFKAAVPDNGTWHSFTSGYYLAQNTTSLKVVISDYPRSTVGYIYGIIALTANSSNPVPVAGTVYLSNGLKQYVSPDTNNGQFFFSLAPGTYEIYAEHVEGGKRFVSEVRRIDIGPVWSPLAVNPTVLVVEPEKVKYLPLLGALLAGALFLIAASYAIKKWL